MAAIINRDDAPGHRFRIPELDFSEDLFAEPLAGLWIRLGALTTTARCDERGVEDTVERQTFLLPPDGFSDVFERLGSVGNVIDNLGKPGGSVLRSGNTKEYRYTPFHRFEFP